jgi:hypothetical protein
VPNDTWEVLDCGCYRCCCCPPTVYYPPTLSVVYRHYNGAEDIADSASFTISCVWPDCPRGSKINPIPPSFDCAYAGEEGKPDGPCVPADDSPGFTGCVERCHACVYNLLGDDGTPGVKGTDDGHGLVTLPSDTPRFLFGHDVNGLALYGYVVGFELYCDCDTGVNGNFPAVPTYVNPDDGVACGWRGVVIYYVLHDGEPVNTNPGPTQNLPTTELLNAALAGNPDLLFNPLDPFKFSCCPLRIRFLLSQYDLDCVDGDCNGYWPDPSEWPPHAGEEFPWNFPFPFNCCTAGCPPDPVTPFDCQKNPYPDFGYIDVSGDASCFLPSEYTTNCLDALKADGAPGAC